MYTYYGYKKIADVLYMHWRRLIIVLHVDTLSPVICNSESSPGYLSCSLFGYSFISSINKISAADSVRKRRDEKIRRWRKSPSF